MAFDFSASQGVDFGTRSFKRKRPRKQQSTISKNPHAVALGKLGGLSGGKSRARKLSPSQRSDIARKAANTRWRKHKKR